MQAALVFFVLLMNFIVAQKLIKSKDCYIPPRKNLAAPGKLKEEKVSRFKY